jgi:micrococcal nuclease
MSKKILIAILTIIVLSVNIFLAKFINPSVQLPETVAGEVADYILPEDILAQVDSSIDYLVTKVIDGDTIEVNINGRNMKVRYIGINTPETINSGQKAGCLADEATLRNKRLVEGQQVRLVSDVSETDKYGRLLRYVYVGDVFVNMALVNEGFAKAITYPPDVKFAQSFLEAEKTARERKVGLWGKACLADSQ